MKKLLVAVCVALFSIAASAQIQGDITAGGHVSYASKIKTVGIGVDIQYNLTDQIRGEASWTYYLKRHNSTTNTVDANLHYLFNVGTDKLYVYPLAGLNYAITTTDLQEGRSHSDGELGINLGGGIQYELKDNLDLKAEVKYTVGDFNPVIIGAGVVYHF